MICEKEYAFFLQILQKSRIQSKEFPLSGEQDLEIDAGLRRQLGVTPSVFAGCRNFFPHMKQGMIYHAADSFYLHYLFFLLPDAPRCMVVGPYLSARPSQQQILETAEAYELPPAQARLLEEFYSLVPRVADDSPFHAMVHCLCETFYGGQVRVRQLSLEEELTRTGLSSAPREDDLSATMRRLENRYRLEDELMLAIAEGSHAKLHQILHGTDLKMAVEARLADPVRNLKNYCIILNTLFRKAAQRGGVHPVYLDDTSRAIAARIEALPTTGAAQRLVREMADQYCLLVRQRSMKGYSRPVQSAMLYVRQHLAEPLNLRTVARTLGFNASYFSARFKKETGQTLTEFILQERMRLAANLLLTTRLQVQSVAQYCGYLDANYFSRTFRQSVGESPTDYRRTARALEV